LIWLEKIKTIGDAYMVVGGYASCWITPKRCRDGSLDAGVLFAAESRREMPYHAHQHQYRSVVAGVIGIKIHPDLWGT
jgi:hypothetical protein